MSEEPDVIEVGSPALDFTLTAHDGSTIRLSDYRDRQNVVLFFMREFT